MRWISALFLLSSTRACGANTHSVLNKFLVSKLVIVALVLSKGSKSRTEISFLNHDESFYCADDLIDYSEDKESVSPAAKRGDDGNYQENYSSNEESDAGEQPAAEIQEA